MKVYIVTEGECDDYRIIGVFATRAIAEQAQKNTLGDDVEEHEVQENAGTMRRGPMYALYIDIETGKIRHMVRFDDVRDESMPIVRPSLYSKDGKAIQLYVASPISKEHAIELACTNRSKCINSDGVFEPIGSC